MCCENCQAWQHNECMEISEDPDELPEQYYCEQCRPGDHKELLAKISKGDKPWEERAKQKEVEEEERRAKRRKGGKKGKGRPSAAKHEDSEEINGNGVLTEAPAAQEPAVETSTETGTKRKLPRDRTSGIKTPDEQVCRELAYEFSCLMPEQEPSSKMRKISTPKVNKPLPQPQRKASVATAPGRKDSSGEVLQTELVEQVEDLHNEIRRRTANGLVKMFVDQTKQAQKQGTFQLPKGQPAEDFGLKLGLAVEYAMYLNLWGNTGQASPEYRSKLLTILHNVKANSALRDRLLNGTLPPNEFSKMSSGDMASKELQEKTAEMKKEAEKQHMLIQEEGPRIRRTHKGEELVGDESGPLSGLDSVYTNVPSRRRESEVDPAAPKQTSPAPMSPDNHSAVELPQDVSGLGPANSPPRPLTVDTQAPPRLQPDRKSSSTFNIQNVWSSVDSPDAEKQRARQQSQRQASGNVPGPVPTSSIQNDADIDHLLKDEEPEDEEPYSPIDYAADEGTVWRGKLAMPGLAEFSGQATFVAGAKRPDLYPWSQLIPSVLSIEGRISTEKASEYLCSLRFSNTTDVTVIAVTSNEDPEAQTGFNKLFNYFTERKRYGVVHKSPLSVIRDIYVVPLDAGSSPKPEFIELLEHCTIEETRPERILLLTYVLKLKQDATPSAQATPRQPDSGIAASPISSQAPSHYRTPAPPMAQPNSHMSPVAPYNAHGSPSQHQGGFAPPPPHQHQQQYHPPYNNSGHAPPAPAGPLQGIDAARQVLGETANAPAIVELLTQAPTTGLVEFEHIKGCFDSVPASRNDFHMLMGLLAMKSQEAGR